MPSRIAVIAIDALQPRVVADFWCEVLGWQVVDEEGTSSVCSPALSRRPAPPTTDGGGRGDECGADLRRTDAARSLHTHGGYCSGSASGSCCSMARAARSRMRLPTTRVKTTLTARLAITTTPAMVPISARPSGLLATTPLR